MQPDVFIGPRLPSWIGESKEIRQKVPTSRDLAT